MPFSKAERESVMPKNKPDRESVMPKKKLREIVMPGLATFRSLFVDFTNAYFSLAHLYIVVRLLVDYSRPPIIVDY